MPDWASIARNRPRVGGRLKWYEWAGCVSLREIDSMIGRANVTFLFGAFRGNSIQRDGMGN